MKFTKSMSVLDLLSVLGTELGAFDNPLNGLHLPTQPPPPPPKPASDDPILSEANRKIELARIDLGPQRIAAAQARRARRAAEKAARGCV
jgi:hypothetical protein